MSGYIYPPSVQIEQVRSTNNPVIRLPRLLAAIIGPCKQLVDVLDADGNINSDALAGTFNGSETVLAFTDLEDGAKVDTDTIEIYTQYGNSSTLNLVDTADYDIVLDGFNLPASIRLHDNAAGVTSGSGVIVNIYNQYEALRTAVTCSPAVTGITGTPRGIYIETVDDIETYLGTIDPRNPLALGAYMAKLNATTTSILCLGVHDTSTGDEVYGTSVAYASALEALESVDVYAMVPLTMSAAINAQFPTHVNSMSALNGKMERIAFVGTDIPDHFADEVQASGSYGSVVDTNTFETSGDLTTVSANDVLTIVNDTTEYVIQSISGTKVDVLPATLSGTTSLAWSIATPGAAITSKTDIATAWAAIGEGYGNYRVYNSVPDICEITINGILYELPGFYNNCMTAGAIGELPPQQPLSNYPLAGVEGLQHSTDYFSPTNLNLIAGGGSYIYFKNTDDSPVMCRRQLSTNVTTTEYSELSIVKQIDYVAKALRNALTPLVGINVITDSFLSGTIAPAVNGYLLALVDAGVIRKYEIVNLAQSTTAPDTVLVEINITPLYPLNTIKVTLVV
jgi:hypothetical protein